MSFKSLKGVNWGALALLFVGLMLSSTLIAGLVVRQDLLELSPISTYQGIHPSFVCVYHEGGYYTTEQTGEATTCRIGPATLNFDPDRADTNLPNLQGELRDIQIVRDLSQYEPGDAYTHIINYFGGEPQPDQAYKSYVWEVEDGDETHIYRMELWLCSVDINLFVNPDSKPWSSLLPSEKNSRYAGSEVWLRLEASNEWGQYFEDVNITNSYFGLAYMELARISGNTDDPQLQVVPMAKWSAFDVYEQIGGEGQRATSPTAYKWEGATLSPGVFKKDWFTKVSLTNFGTYDWNRLDGSYKADSIQLRALVHIFVVGEWVVKPEQERDMDPHTPPRKRGWFEDNIYNLDQWLKNPFNRLQFGFILTVLIIGVILILSPGLLIGATMSIGKYMEKRSKGS